MTMTSYNRKETKRRYWFVQVTLLYIKALNVNMPIYIYIYTYIYIYIYIYQSDGGECTGDSQTEQDMYVCEI